MASGIFTSYDTVRFNDGKEYIVDEFFNKIKEDIKSKKIYNCHYNADEEKFIYENKGEVFTVSIEGKGSRVLRIINEAIDLEKALKVHEENVQKEADRKKALLDKAINGKVESDEAKDLYLEYLKKERIKAFTESFHFTFKELELSNSRLESIAIPVWVANGGVVLITLVVAFIKWLLVVTPMALSTFFKIVTLPVIFDVSIFINDAKYFLKIIELITRGVVGTVMTVPNVIKGFINFFRNGLSKIKLINHKIKWLSDYHLPDESIDIKINEDVDSKDIDFAKDYINNIHEALLSLSSSDKAVFIGKLKDLTDEYHKEINEINSLANGELTTKSEYSARIKFLVGLSELCKEISPKALAGKNTHSFEFMVKALENAIINDTNTSNVVMTSDGKTRKLERDKMAMPL